ncbi:MAG: sugar transferase [Patescibacteria group bacterium]|nr:sugar transferase [Patescibacteria group bacterium]
MNRQDYFIIKRVMDIFFGIFLGLFFLPISLATALAIKLDSKGPVFADTPKRVSKNGRLFHLYKFRSMIVDAHNLLRTDPRYKNLYEKYKKGSYKLSIEEDPRITKVGRFIRKYSIDEVPQLINVLRGEMSLVGPRPYYPDELKEQEKKYPDTKNVIKEALSVKPGLTGLWQVSGRSNVNFDKRIKLDAYYARRKSILLDLIIILKSPWVMIGGRGCV